MGICIPWSMPLILIYIYFPQRHTFSDDSARTKVSKCLRYDLKHADGNVTDLAITCITVLRVHVQVHTLATVRKQLHALASSCSLNMLFLKNVEKVEVYEIHATAPTEAKPQIKFSCR